MVVVFERMCCCVLYHTVMCVLCVCTKFNERPVKCTVLIMFSPALPDKCARVNGTGTSQFIFRFSRGVNKISEQSDL